MMMALSNKSKRTCFVTGIVKEKVPPANQTLSSDVDNSAFDMEKYLKKTDEIGHESECESVVKHEASDTFLLGKDKNKDILSEDFINNHSKQQEIEKRFLDYFNEENDTQNFSSLSGVPNHEDVIANRAKYSDKSSDLANSKHLQSLNIDLGSDRLNTQTSPTGNEVQICGIPSAAEMEVAQRSPLPYQTDNLSSRCIREDTETVDQATNAVPESCNDLEERSAGNTLSLSNLKHAKPSRKYVSVSPTKAMPTQRLNSDEKKQNAKIEKRNKHASIACNGNAKHVTFEKLSPTSQNSTGK